MFKVLSALALISATLLPVDAAKASSGWQSYLGDRLCVHLRRGESAYDAGYNAALDMFSSRYKNQFSNAYDRLTKNQFNQILARQVMSKCPNAIRNAN